MEELWTLDFEASSLNMADSYPIEVGYTNGNGFDREMIILPDDSWTDWDPLSQDVHTIRRKDLFAFGLPIGRVCETMNNDLDGKQVYCDGGLYDTVWLVKLFKTANMNISFTLQYFMGSHKDNEYVAHRALADAKQLWETIRNG